MRRNRGKRKIDLIVAVSEQRLLETGERISGKDEVFLRDIAVPFTTIKQTHAHLGHFNQRIIILPTADMTETLYADLAFTELQKQLERNPEVIGKIYGVFKVCILKRGALKSIW